MPRKRTDSRLRDDCAEAVDADRHRQVLMEHFQATQEGKQDGETATPPTGSPALADPKWPALLREALAGQPVRLYEALSSIEYTEWLARVLGLAVPDSTTLPIDVRTTVAELRRVRRGRPRNTDMFRSAAAAWQLHEAQEIYRAYLRQYQTAKEADRTGNAIELHVGGKPQIAYVDAGSRPSRRNRLPPVVRVHGARLSPKEHALEATAYELGRTAEAIRKLIFGATTTLR